MKIVSSSVRYVLLSVVLTVHSLPPVPSTSKATVIKAAIERAKIDSLHVDEVIMGNVLQAGLGQNPARQALLKKAD